MNLEHTLVLLKPDAIERNIIGKIISMYEENNFAIAGMQLLQLDDEQAAEFYEIHKERPFFDSLVEYMSSGPIVAMVLAKENAVSDNRKLMGATNPEEAEEGTIRKLFAESIERNSVHGSDSLENAEKEINFFFEMGMADWEEGQDGEEDTKSA